MRLSCRTTIKQSFYPASETIVNPTMATRQHRTCFPTLQPVSLLLLLSARATDQLERYAARNMLLPADKRVWYDVPLTPCRSGSCSRFPYPRIYNIRISTSGFARGLSSRSNNYSIAGSRATSAILGVGGVGPFGSLGSILGHDYRYWQHSAPDEIELPDR